MSQWMPISDSKAYLGLPATTWRVFVWSQNMRTFIFQKLSLPPQERLRCQRHLPPAPGGKPKRLHFIREIQGPSAILTITSSVESAWISPPKSQCWIVAVQTTCLLILFLLHICNCLPSGRSMWPLTIYLQTCLEVKTDGVSRIETPTVHFSRKHMGISTAKLILRHTQVHHPPKPYIKIICQHAIIWTCPSATPCCYLIGALATLNRPARDNRFDDEKYRDQPPEMHFSCCKKWDKPNSTGLGRISEPINCCFRRCTTPSWSIFTWMIKSSRKNIINLLRRTQSVNPWSGFPWEESGKIYLLIPWKSAIPTSASTVVECSTLVVSLEDGKGRKTRVNGKPTRQWRFAPSFLVNSIKMDDFPLPC